MICTLCQYLAVFKNGEIMSCLQINNFVKSSIIHAFLAPLILLNFIVAMLFCSSASARTTLTSSDLTYLGSFAVPRVVGDYRETPYGFGLALRRVNGEVRLFSSAFEAGDNFSLYEMKVPALRKSTPWNVAPVAKFWGNVFTNKQGWINGLYWDEADQRLYYSSSWDYVAGGDPYDPSLAFLTFSPDETSATSYGRWGFTNRSFKQVNFGVTPIPADFATQYLGGKRLAAGFGGYQSVMGHGPTSQGPSLTAFSPPAVGTQGGYLSNTPLVGYGGSHDAWTTGSKPKVDRCWRDDDVIQDLYGTISDPDNSTQNTSPYWHLTGDETFYWQGYSITKDSRAGIPDNPTYQASSIVTKHWEPGNAFWNNDFIWQAGTWIQTANKEGILFLGTFTTGHTWYYASNSHGEGMNQRWLIYSRDQFASVVQGTVTEDKIQPARYPADFSNTGVGSHAHSGIPKYNCVGMVFDPTDNKLYVALQYASNAPTLNMHSTHLIYVYQINDSILPLPTILNITGGPRLSPARNMEKLLADAGEACFFQEIRRKR